jgi:hypothetical protein
MQFSLLFHYFIPLWSKYPTQHPCSQIPSVYIHPLMLETNLRTHTEIQEKLVLYIANFTFLDSRREDRRFRTEKYQTLLDFNLLLISSWIKFQFVTVVPQIYKLTFVQTICWLFLCYGFDLNSGDEVESKYSDFSTFNSRATSLLA